MDKQNVMEAEQITGAYIGRKSDTCGDNMAYHWIIVVTGGRMPMQNFFVSGHQNETLFFGTKYIKNIKIYHTQCHLRLFQV